MVTTETGTKRKRPPTFQHFPANRAKKLKKTWVDTKKLKSKWKAEKRKSGLATGSNAVEQKRQSEEGGGHEEGPSDHSSSGEGERDNEPLNSPPQQQPTKTRSNNESRRDDSAQKEQSLRDKTREAYSRSSLHNFRSDPLSRTRGHGGGSHRGRGGRGNDRTVREGGRGQPNMKLRMGAMLEKIKRDYS